MHETSHSLHYSCQASGSCSYSRNKQYPHSRVDSYSGPFQALRGIFYCYSSKTATAFMGKEKSNQKQVSTPKCFFKLSQWNSTVSTSFPLLFFHTVLVKLLTTDRKGHIVFTRPLHFCYIILGTGDFKGIYLNKDTIVLAAVSTQFVFPKFRDYLGN